MDWIIMILQQTVINSSMSSCGEISSEVPPGSILGLLLFITFINHLKDEMAYTLSKSADKTRWGAATLEVGLALKITWIN